jgi:hypothetical protein
MAGRAVIVAGAFAAWTVMLPWPVPESRRLHPAAGARVEVQVVAMVKGVAERVRSVAVAEPRLRRVRIGLVSAERARAGCCGGGAGG